MELKLNNNDRLQLHWIRPGVLAVEVHRPMNRTDGHGICLAGCAYVEGDELTAFLAALQPPETGNEWPPKAA